MYRCVLKKTLIARNPTTGPKVSTRRRADVGLKLQYVLNFMLVWLTGAKHIASGTYEIKVKLSSGNPNQMASYIAVLGDTLPTSRQDNAERRKQLRKLAKDFTQSLTDFKPNTEKYEKLFQVLNLFHLNFI